MYEQRQVVVRGPGLVYQNNKAGDIFKADWEEEESQGLSAEAKAPDQRQSPGQVKWGKRKD